MSEHKTDKIGFAAYLVTRNIKLARAEVKNRNRATFVFEADDSDWSSFEQEYLCSDHARFFEAFKHLREMTIRGS
jgi:hypothetical protein